ncbi:hypothetical protein LTR56_000132 [Elasticomyces elasticus]|nr:hypothetical protein LTR56_000132 [Elasticomyces elasticus]KAK3667120.1 hypothetical protein LTR22_001984 [Elasticomyces elasticus]KAK4932895.1 hypothetical protein LTR49_000851 [Elasticomyces elasticus]KAK5768701.1 hypothetical protein LTS12_001127 [Elasticomyces elasticus]
MAGSKALHKQLNAYIALREASEEALWQQRDEAYKVADYLKQKLDSLEDIISDLNDGEDVKALFEGYSDDMETLEQVVLGKAGRRQTEQHRIEASTALPMPAPEPTTKSVSDFPPEASLLDNVEAHFSKLKKRSIAKANAVPTFWNSSSSDSSSPEAESRMRFAPKLPSPIGNRFGSIKAKKSTSARQFAPQTTLATSIAQQSSAAKTLKDLPAKKKRKHSVVLG